MSPYAMALSPGVLTFIRKATGLTQKEFADSIGVSHSTIGSYETGERRMSEETWSKIKTVHREILDNLDVPDTLVTESELCIKPEHIRRIRILAGLSQREFAESMLKRSQLILEEWDDTIWTVMVEKALVHKV